MPSQKNGGWGVVVTTWFCLFVGASPVIVFTFGNFMKPLSEAFGWSRGFMSSGMAVGAIAAAILAPVLGRLIDSMGIRKITLPALIVAALAVAAQSLQTGHAAVFYILSAIAGGLTVALTALPYAKAISLWFDRNRGLALGISTLGGALGVAVIPQIAQYVITGYGWRQAYIVLAVLILVIAFIPALLWLRTPPGIEQAAAVEVAFGPSASEGRRDWRLWALCISFLLAAAAISGPIGQLVPMLTDRGFSPAQATGMLGVYAIASTLARLISGLILDRVFAPILGAIVFLAGACGLLLILFGSGDLSLLVGIFLCGISVGAEYDILPFIISRYFGTKAFGELVGYGFLSFTLGTGAFGPLIMGNSYTMLGSYNYALGIFTIFLLFSAILLVSIGPYRFKPSNQ